MRIYSDKAARRVGTGALCLTVASLAMASVLIGAAGGKGAIGKPISAREPALLVHRIWPPDPTVPPSPPPTTAPPARPQPPNERPSQYKPPPPPPPKPTAPPTSAPAQAVAAAVNVGRARGVRVGVAVRDRQTGAFYGGGDVDGYFAAASVMKVFIATRLLVDGRAGDPTIASLMWKMIVASDDDAARTLYQLAGTESLIPWIVSRYGIGGLAPTPVPGWWGLTRITARAMVNFYAVVAGDPVVAPWLLNAMANTRATASDGFHQLFGIPSAATSWRVKQGWMCCLENLTRMHSTGYITGNRYTVALLIQGGRSVYGNYGAQTLTLMARALLPGGTLPPAPQPSPSPSPTASPSPSPSASPSPSPAESPSPSPSSPPSEEPSPSPGS